MPYMEQHKITKGQNVQAKLRVDKIKVMLTKLVQNENGDIPSVNITEYEATTTRSIDEQLQQGYTLTYNQYGFLSNLYKKLSRALRESYHGKTIEW